MERGSVTDIERDTIRDSIRDIERDSDKDSIRDSEENSISITFPLPLSTLVNFVFF